MTDREEEIQLFRTMYRLARSAPETTISLQGQAGHFRLIDVVIDRWIELLEEETVEKGAEQRQADRDCVNALLNDCDIPLP